MAYFPLFVNLEGKRCLVVGGKKVALRKAKALAEYGGVIFAVAEEFCEGWEGWGETKKLMMYQRKAVLEDARGMDLVICASDDTALHKEISSYCKERKIPVNVADSPKESSFLFPALVRQKDVVFGITTGGNSPAASRYLREKLECWLPGYLGDLVEQMGSLRRQVKEAFPEQKQREEVFSRIFFSALEAGEVHEELIKAAIPDDVRRNARDNV